MRCRRWYKQLDLSVIIQIMLYAWPQVNICSHAVAFLRQDIKIVIVPPIVMMLVRAPENLLPERKLLLTSILLIPTLESPQSFNSASLPEIQEPLAEFRLGKRLVH